MTKSARRLGTWNDVSGCPGWVYGLRVRQADGSVVFSAHHPESRQAIEELRARATGSPTLARRMGEHELQGYQHVAREAIRALRV